MRFHIYFFFKCSIFLRSGFFSKEDDVARK